MGAQTARDNGWTRSCVNLRLTPERTGRLLALAAKSGSKQSPTEAIDRAIAIAFSSLAPNSEDGQTREGLQEALERHQAACEKHAASHQRTLLALANDVQALRNLIFDAAGLETSPGAVDALALPTMSEWIRRDAMGMQRRALLLLARWQSTIRVAEGLVSMVFLVERVAAEGAGILSESMPSEARLDNIENDSQLTRAQSKSEVYMVCKWAQGEWHLVAHEIKPDRRVGHAI